MLAVPVVPRHEGKLVGVILRQTFEGIEFADNETKFRKGDRRGRDGDHNPRTPDSTNRPDSPIYGGEGRRRLPYQCPRRIGPLPPRPGTCRVLTLIPHTRPLHLVHADARRYLWLHSDAGIISPN